MTWKEGIIEIQSVEKKRYFGLNWKFYREMDTWNIFEGSKFLEGGAFACFGRINLYFLNPKKDTPIFNSLCCNSDGGIFVWQEKKKRKKKGKKKRREVERIPFGDSRCRIFSKQKWDQESMSAANSVHRCGKFERSLFTDEYTSLFEARLASAKRFWKDKQTSGLSGFCEGCWLIELIGNKLFE